MNPPGAHLSPAGSGAAAWPGRRVGAIIGSRAGARRWAVARLAAGLLTTAFLYLGAAVLFTGAAGFPLDDAWIHQVFARHLAQGYGLAFNPGEPVAGTTAPLWTVLLVPGHLTPGLFPVWTYLLGLLALGLAAALTGRITARLTARPAVGAFAVLAVVLDWRLDWAALSGMETVLFAALSLAALDFGLRPNRRPVLAGVLAGLAALTRPEGVLLLPVIAGLHVLTATRSARPQRQRAVIRAARDAALLGGAAIGPLLVGMALNWSAGGAPLPSTFYAKGDFYGGVGGPAGALRYLTGAAESLFWGPLLALAPGVLAAAVRWRRAGTDGWGLLLAGLAAWAALLPLVYLVRLPVLFHHGRYLLPAIPPLVVLGVWGGEWLLRRLPYRRLARVIPLCLAAFYLALWLNGAQVYAWNVRYIQDEQVRVARWLAERAEPAAVVATHDVGAIGFFSGLRVIDLAGLMTPELTGHLHDQEYLANYLVERDVDYLAILPDWYPVLAARTDWRLVFAVNERYVVEAGGTNFRIYWRPL